MSQCDTDTDLKTPCPNCGGVVHHWYFSPGDSSGPSSGIDCKKCKTSFSREEWDGVEKRYKEIKEIRGRERRRPKRYLLELRCKTHPRYRGTKDHARLCDSCMLIFFLVHQNGPLPEDYRNGPIPYHFIGDLEGALIGLVVRHPFVSR